MDPKEIAKVIRLHGLWLNKNPKGKQADLGGADLDGADLRDANLRWANLCGANLCDADLSHVKGAVFFITEGYICIVQEGFITIGCQRHSCKEWTAFSDAEIEQMGNIDLALWNKHRETILSMNV